MESETQLSPAEIILMAFALIESYALLCADYHERLIAALEQLRAGQ
jgi:hypothetical protein